MPLTITDVVMRSPNTPHIALCSKSGCWRVSWLPGRAFTRDQAEAAMSIAEAAAQADADCDPEVYDDEFWERIDTWAAELQLTGPDAVGLVFESTARALTDGGDR
jgi:hypothetical protein